MNDTTDLQNAGPFEAIPPYTPIVIRLKFPRGNLSIGDGLVLARMFGVIIARALRSNGILSDPSAANLDSVAPVGEQNTCAFKDEAFGLFRVTDRAVALSLIRAELEELEILEHARIGWIDWQFGGLRSYYPAGSADDICESLEVIMQHNAEVGQAIQRMKEGGE
jgi:hypothetical protein